MKNSTTRFSDRVENYIKYRPFYPLEVLNVLKSECGLTENIVVVDIGAGTGKLTKLFLENDYKVLAIEPNKEMREAAVNLLSQYSDFTSIAATAEDTGLAENSIGLIVAGQAFHWFDPKKSKLEFSRILRPGGWVALIWNKRQVDTTPFLREYESILQKHATDYEVVDHKNIGEDAIAAFFSPGSFQLKTSQNNQLYDYEGLRGRCLSSSYTPNEGFSGYEALVTDLKQSFDRYQKDGVIAFEYETQVFYGQLTK